jgi:hypothetical protein
MHIENITLEDKKEEPSQQDGANCKNVPSFWLNASEGMCDSCYENESL